MNYKFLVKEEINRLFDQPHFNVGDIIRIILQEKFTNIKVGNKRRLSEMTDCDWYEAIEKSFEYEQE